MFRRIAWIAVVVVLVGVLAYAALELSPRPAALFYGYFMNRGGEKLNAALERHVPEGVAAVLIPEPALDVYYPARASGPLPAIVWTHGGAFFAGDRKHGRAARSRRSSGRTAGRSSPETASTSPTT